MMLCVVIASELLFLAGLITVFIKCWPLVTTALLPLVFYLMYQRAMHNVLHCYDCPLGKQDCRYFLLSADCRFGGKRSKLISIGVI